MTSDPKKRIQFHYIKSPAFRTIHADGMVGGVTPNGNVHISFFNERGPIPQLIEHEIEHDNSLGKEIVEARIGKIGVVREVDTDVIMNLATALAFKDWLDEKINTLQSAVNTQKEKS